MSVITWTAEPIVIGFGLTTEATINDPAATQCAASFTGGGVQQLTTIKVIFFVNIKGFVELLTVIPFLNNFTTRPPGNTQLIPAAIKFNILTSRNLDQNFYEFRIS